MGRDDHPLVAELAGRTPSSMAPTLRPRIGAGLASGIVWVELAVEERLQPERPERLDQVAPRPCRPLAAPPAELGRGEGRRRGLRSRACSGSGARRRSAARSRRREEQGSGQTRAIRRVIIVPATAPASLPRIELRPPSSRRPDNRVSGPKKNRPSSAPRRIVCHADHGSGIVFPTRRWIVSRASWLKALALARPCSASRVGLGEGPGLDRLPALALRAAPGPRQRVRIQRALRRLYLYPREQRIVPQIQGPYYRNFYGGNRRPRASAIPTAGTTGTRRSSTRATTSPSTSSERSTGPSTTRSDRARPVRGTGRRPPRTRRALVAGESAHARGRTAIR